MPRNARTGTNRHLDINAYCTTSYFAPAILLKRNGFSITNFFASVADVGAWQKQIDAVIAGKIDATMVDEDTWLAKPENASNTRILGRVDELPAPVVIALAAAGKTFIASLTKQLLAEPRAPRRSVLRVCALSVGDCSKLFCGRRAGVQRLRPAS